MASEKQREVCGLRPDVQLLVDKVATCALLQLEKVILSAAEPRLLLMRVARGIWQQSTRPARVLGRGWR